MSCEDCLSRREFLSRTTLAVAGAAALASGCGNGQFGPTAVVAKTNSVSLKVASVPALAAIGQVVQIAPANAYIAVKRTSATTFIAFSTICTHQGCATAVVGNGLACPCHGSRYDSDGHIIHQPDFGSATNLPTYGTRYDAATDTLTIG